MLEQSYLDNRSALTEVDKENLFTILQQFPDQLETATKEFAQLVLPAAWGQVDRVIFCGMGGSGIGGEIASDLPANLIRKSLFVVRDYNLPGFVDKNSLVVIVTYSGETEETLACLSEALTKNCQVLIVTSDKVLAEKEYTDKVLVYKFNYQAPPRDSLGYLLAPLIKVLELVGVLNTKETDIGSAITLLRDLIPTWLPTTITDNNKAKTLAYSVYDKVPVIFSSGILRSVARRWKCQFNEHSKTASFFEVFPELNHNTVEGFQFPSRLKDDIFVILLESSFDHPEVCRRIKLFKEFLQDNHIQYEVITSVGQDLWSQKFSSLALGDWVSYYLALLNRVNPTAIPAISGLKKKLRSK